MDANLLTVFDKARQAIDGSRSAREDAERLLDGLSSRLIVLETIEQRLTMAAAALQGGASVEPSQADDGPLAAIVNLEATFANLELALATANPPSALAALDQGIAQVTELVDQAAADIADDLDEITESVSDAVGTFEERCHNAADQVDAIGDDVREWMDTRKQEIEDTTEEITSLLDDYETAADTVTGELIETVTTAYLTDVLAKVDDVGTELVDVVGGLGQQGHEGIGRITESLHDLTQQLGAIVDVIEPVKPVLDTASAIT
jgi:ABC-type transporter Mla subunit MlaD